MTSRPAWRAELARVRWGWVIGGYAAAMLVGIGIALWLQQGGNWRAGLSWEPRFMLAVHAIQIPDVLDHAMLVLPWLATNITLLPASILLAGWLWIARRRYLLATQLLVVELGCITMNPLLKHLFQRPRPELWEWRGQFAWTSYPSGHAIASIAVLLTWAILIRRERGWRWPYVALSLLVLVSLYSRIYLGVHWPTDVLGGAMIGAVWLVATLHAFGDDATARRAPVRREHARRPVDAVPEPR
ncbi:MAG TPA: phosphatase PAP2 family protein [Gemmatimonadaceae bacterium]|nr:phosphatase PAP2 family protein [Gemmatimonadaceae bacterium]